MWPSLRGFILSEAEGCPAGSYDHRFTTTTENQPACAVKTQPRTAGVSAGSFNRRNAGLR